MVLDEFYRGFAVMAARHEPLMRHDAIPNPSDSKRLKEFRAKFATAVDDISNLLNIVEAISGEKVRGR